MKTSTKSTTLLLAALLLSLNIFAIGIEFDQENYIDDIPFNVEEVINQITYENAIAVNFSFDEEEYIDDIPAVINNQTSNISYTDAISQDFRFQEEEYIDDIPVTIVIQSCYRIIASTK